MFKICHPITSHTWTIVIASLGYTCYHNHPSNHHTFASEGFKVLLYTYIWLGRANSPSFCTRPSFLQFYSIMHITSDEFGEQKRAVECKYRSVNPSHIEKISALDILSCICHGTATIISHNLAFLLSPSPSLSHSHPEWLSNVPWKMISKTLNKNTHQK